MRYARTIVLLSVFVLAGRAGEQPRVANPPPAVQSSPAPPPGQPLTEQELAELTQRAEEPGPEVTGGALSNLHLTYIVIALAAAVLVLVLK